MPVGLTSSSIRINLARTETNDKLPTIRPGAVLYGEVQYKPATTERLSALTVCLLGKLIVKAPKGRREVTQIFGVQHPIVKSEEEPVLVEARLNRFPFHFVVPWTTEYDRSGFFKDDAAHVFEERPHMVPPSLCAKAKGDAQVCYSCYVVGRTAGIRRSNDLAVMQDFPQGQELENIQCVVELPHVEARPPSRICRQIQPPRPKPVSGLFRRSSVVSVKDTMQVCGTWDITLTSPSVVQLGTQLTLEAKAERRREEFPPTDDSDWSLALATVELVSTTYRRLRDVTEPWVDETARSLLSSSKPAPLKDGVTCTYEITIADADFTTSFKSYSISRVHTIRIGVSSTYLDPNESKKIKLQEIIHIDLDVQLVRIGDVIGRSASNVGEQDAQGCRIAPPKYEDCPVYSA